VPYMKSDIVPQRVADVADAVYRRTDEVSILLARAITREVRLYGPTAAVPLDVVAAGCAANMRAIFGAIAAGGDFNVTAATQLGIERARDGVPLSSVMEAYRVGFRRVWEAVAAEAATRPGMNGDALRTLTAKLLTAQDLFTNAMAAGYRQEQTRRVVDDETQRFMLIDALMHGRLFERCSLWEAADYLRLPSTGPFVVIAADIARSGLTPCRISRRSYAAWMCPPHGRGCPTCKSGSRTSAPTAIWLRRWRWFLGWPPPGWVSARASTICATPRAGYVRPG
jgi:hypothetical protein